MTQGTQQAARAPIGPAEGGGHGGRQGQGTGPRKVGGGGGQDTTGHMEAGARLITFGVTGREREKSSI